MGLRLLILSINDSSQLVLLSVGEKVRGSPHGWYRRGLALRGFVLLGQRRVCENNDCQNTCRQQAHQIPQTAHLARFVLNATFNKRRLSCSETNVAQTLQELSEFRTPSFLFADDAPKALTAWSQKISLSCRLSRHVSYRLQCRL